METLVRFARRFKRKMQWNWQYLRGHWDYLDSPPERERLEVVLGLMKKWVPAGREMLEIGCGEGIFFSMIDPAFYRSYLGIDVSDVAIKKAKKRSTAAARFAVGDMEVFRTESLFDLIVFNECLYYSFDAVALIRRFQGFLQPGGRIILSVYEMGEIKPMLAALADNFPPAERALVENGNGKWHIMVH